MGSALRHREPPDGEGLPRSQTRLGKPAVRASAAGVQVSPFGKDRAGIATAIAKSTVARERTASDPNGNSI
jgi:hypothetical protein